MKKLCVILLALLLFTGCTEKKTYETISDGLEQQKLPAMLSMDAHIPADALTPVFQDSSAGTFYDCGEFTATMHAVPVGDFGGLIRDITGFDMEQLQVLESYQEGLKSYQVVWSSTGEGQTQVGKANILTDGNYYYVLTAMAPEDLAGKLTQGAWKELFSSFRAVPKDEIVNSGS